MERLITDVRVLLEGVEAADERERRGDAVAAGDDLLGNSWRKEGGKVAGVEVQVRATTGEAGRKPVLTVTNAHRALGSAELTCACSTSRAEVTVLKVGMHGACSAFWRSRTLPPSLIGSPISKLGLRRSSSLE
jgi:hypothetical protein